MHESQVSDDLPTGERTLAQMLQATQELHSRVSQTSVQDMQADKGCTQTQFIEQAKRYLENRYKLFMQTANAEHLRDAHRDGILSILNLVGSLVRLKFA
ncbi:hypothetical protein pipiens_019017 [Culex pipiens pipiens]|uniref:Uncharacterized protein n=1 Tax=Culex pipiens pipiens TaxID=38569 RepID=A0ABD1DWR0_CULPP